MLRTRNKYGNKKTCVDGVVFDSKAEAEYYSQLKIMQRANEVKYFSLQPKFLLQGAFVHRGKSYRAIYYIADFKVIYADGHQEIIDVKGHKTKEYQLKKKLFLSKHPEIIFKEV